jgi:hypothetical protein
MKKLLTVFVVSMCASLPLTGYSQGAGQPPLPVEGVFDVLANIENIIDLSDKQQSEINALRSEVKPTPPPRKNPGEEQVSESLDDEAALYAEHMAMNRDKIGHDREMTKLETTVHLRLQQILSDEQLGQLHDYELSKTEQK